MTSPTGNCSKDILCCCRHEQAEWNDDTSQQNQNVDNSFNQGLHGHDIIDIATGLAVPTFTDMRSLTNHRIISPPRCYDGLPLQTAQIKDSFSSWITSLIPWRENLADYMPQQLITVKTVGYKFIPRGKE